MVEETKSTAHVVDRQRLPTLFPTHAHSPLFWEALGRAIATFGFLEEVLARAIFAFTATKPISESEFEAEFRKWRPALERALYDPLGNLIDAYGKAVRSYPGTTIENLERLLDDLREASTYRNVLCHGSWRCPDDQGRSMPFFFDPKLRVFEIAIYIAFLLRGQKCAVELCCAVVNSVTHMGWQFPGSAGPGKPIV